MSEKKNEHFARSFQYFQKLVKQSGPAAAASYSLIGGIIILVLVGYFLDEWLGTKPWLMLFGLMMGLFSGFYGLAKTIWRK
ncbi:MAG: AtpZ/AtpI family protein [Candidatus Marinimicrobia bacterium]|nr:AtpZ/AtpI family protein [Candidatus Neomarinimicrobiota bacterium]MCH7763233.1 AtpZ/AtpI family protein [Candidatus Neomarinimicrobiota bacterium]